MSGFGIRPGFSDELEFGVEEARSRLVACAEGQADRCEVLSFPGFVCLRVPEKDRHFWSPRLHLSLEGMEEGGTRVRGTFGPNANMWSAFLYGFLLVGSLSLFSGILGLCQWSLGQQPWGLWIFGGVFSVVVGLYGVAQVGKKLGAHQTRQLHEVYEAAMGTSVAMR